MQEPSLGIGITKCERIAPAAYLAAIIDGEDLRNDLLASSGLTKDELAAVDETVKEACSLWAKAAGKNVSNIEELRKLGQNQNTERDGEWRGGH